MRFVPIKEQAQLDLQTIHRVRQRLVGRRTALINQLRAILLERGIIIPQRRRVLDRQLPGLLADDGNGLSPRIRLLIEDIRAEWRELDTRIKVLDDELIATAKTVDTCRRLCGIPGIGALNATALLAAVSNGAAFGKGRDMAAWLGLTPREHSTGGKQRLLGISKRGNTYLRTLLIHGARAALPFLAARQDALGEWLRRLLVRAHRNVVIVALANKLARIAWAVLRLEFAVCEKRLKGAEGFQQAARDREAACAYRMRRFGGGQATSRMVFGVEVSSVFRTPRASGWILLV